MKPHIVVRRDKADESQVVRQRPESRRRGNSSSSSSGSDNEPISRQKWIAVDGSSGDHKKGTRRQRLLAKRRRLARETKVDLDVDEAHSADKKETAQNESNDIAPAALSIRTMQQRKALSSSDSSSNGDGGSSDDSSSSSEAECSDDGSCHV